MAKHILCTGGAGYIGSHTVVKLIESGFDVSIMDNFVNSNAKVLDRVKQLTGKDVPLFRVDMCDNDGVDRIFASANFDGVIHFAGLKAVGESVAKPLMYYHNNIKGTICIMKAMKKYGCKAIVFSSSATVYKPCETPLDELKPLGCSNPYGWTKLMIEQIMQDEARADTGLGISLLRYFNPCGSHPSGKLGESPNGIPNNLMPFLQQVAVGRREFLSIFGSDYPTIDGTGVRDYIHVDDLAEGHICAMKKLLEVQGECMGALCSRLQMEYNVPPTRDLTIVAETNSILEMATAITKSGASLSALGDYAYNQFPAPPANILAAIKNAESFAAMKRIPPCHLTVIFPMYKERNRASTKEQHKNGQDFIRNKCKQLSWLFEANPACTWDLMACDDGCPEDSASFVNGIAAESGLTDKFSVCSIQEAIDKQVMPFATTIKTTADSRKGGAVVYGLHKAHETSAARSGGKPHLIIYTDSDLSSDLGMSGSLMHKVMCEGCELACGARYGYKGSFLVKENGATGHPASHLEQPNVVHITMRHFCRMHLLPDIATLTDTNVGFKCYQVKDMPILVPKMSIWGPAFDMQLLLAALVHYKQGTGKTGAQIVGVCPILFTEDFAESNFTSNAENPDASFKSFVQMDQEICKMHDEYVTEGERTAKAREVKAFVESWDVPAYKAMINGLEGTYGRNFLFGHDFDLAELKKLAASAVAGPEATLCAKLEADYSVPPTRDLTIEAETLSILEMGTAIVKSGLNIEALGNYAYNAFPPPPANILAALKNAESFEQMKKVPACHLTVVFPMYKERNRASTKAQHKNGQDFIRNKCKQLAWLFEANPGCTWDLMACDDGCPEDSATFVNQIAAEAGLTDKFSVCSIQEAIDKQVMPFATTIKSTSDSRKGGAVVYGLHKAHETSAARSGGKPHLIIYTDSDLSSDLGMSGSLIHKVLCEGCELACGARYGYKGSFLVKENGARGHPQSHFEQPNVVHITMRHFCRMHLLPDISALTDTNVGFKCYQVKDMPILVPKMSIWGPAFDMQLLLAALAHYKGTTGKTGPQIVGVCPILFVEDFAESNFSSNAENPDASFTSFVQMDQEICKMHTEYVPEAQRTEKANRLRAFVESWDTEGYKGMINGIEGSVGRNLMFGHDFDMDMLEQLRPKPTPESLCTRLKKDFKVPFTRDLTIAAETQSCLDMASAMIGSGVSLEALGNYSYNQFPPLPANILAAVKNAESYAAMQQVPPCHLTVIFPMYKERNRASTKEQHPNGQDFIRNKCKQLSWLFAANPGCTWDLMACDDGCPEDSATFVNQIAAEAGLTDKFSVCSIQEAIDKQVMPFAATIKTTADSRKGGAVLYGLHKAHETSAQRSGGKTHLIIYTDSDLSSDLGMSGSLIHKVLCGDCELACGARYGYKGSFLVKENGATGHPASHFEQPNVVHITMRHFCRQHLLPDIATLTDTNVGFKCYQVKDMPTLLPKMSIWGPAFDMQLLLAALAHYREQTKKTGAQIVGVCPILFTEDFAESNFTSNAENPDASFKSFVQMDQEICKMHDEYVVEGERTAKARELKAFVESWDVPAYKAMVNSIEGTYGRNLMFGHDFDMAELKKFAASAVAGPEATLCIKLAQDYNVPPTRDLTIITETQSCLDMATVMVNSGIDLEALGNYAYNAFPPPPANILAALKNAESFSQMKKIPACHLTVIFPMYKERNRASTKEQHKNGQDFIRNKCKQLSWLFEANPACTWDLMACDDGCPDDSASFVNGIAAEAGLTDKFSVCSIQEAIDKQVMPFATTIKTTADSRKGGAVVFGLHKAHENSAARSGGKPHLIIYTDSDLSSDLGMSGSLMHKVLCEGCELACGARYGYKGSFLVKENGARGHPQSHFEQPNVVHITMRHFCRMHLLPDIATLTDTNVGFKCYQVKDMPTLVPKMSIWGPAFDMQLLLAALQHYKGTTGKTGAQIVGVCPILFVEDFAESNFSSNAENPDAAFKSFVQMDQEICQMHYEYVPEAERTTKAKQLKAFVESWDVPGYKRLINGIEGKIGRNLLFGHDFDVAELAAMRSGSSSAVAPSRVLIHNLGSGKGMSVLEMVKGLEGASGKKLAYKMLDRRPGDLGVVVANPAKARADFGWQTKRGIKEIMESAWKWQSENPYGFDDPPAA